MSDQQTYTQLKNRWVGLRDIIDKSPNPPNWADREEQEAWDNWVTWVEDNDLNGTTFDPRGPEDGNYTSTVEWVQ